MRLNLRLMGVLFGILLIGLTGYILLRSTSGYRVRVNDRDDDRGGRNVLPLIGLALYVIGYVGVFFANLIKAAVSRQREFLADASAVQFTRNPDGIAGALKKIGALSAGLGHPRAAGRGGQPHVLRQCREAGQLFGLLETHPPLVERIRRLDPSFDGDFSKVRLEPPGDQASQTPAGRIVSRAARSFSFNPAEAVGRVGTIGAPQLLYAAGLLEDLGADPCPRKCRIRSERRPRFSPCCSTRQRPCTSSSFRGSTGMLIQPWCGRCVRCCPKSGSLPQRRGCRSWRWPFRRCGRCRRPRCANSWRG